MKIALAIMIQALACGLLKAQDFTRFYKDSADIQVAMHLLKDSANGFWLGGFKSKAEENTKAWIYHLNAQGEPIGQIKFPGNEAQVWAGMTASANNVSAIIGLQQFTGETRYYLANCRGDSLERWTYLPELDNAVLHDSRPAAGNRLLVSGFKGSEGLAGNDFFLARVRTDSARVDWVFYSDFGINDHISTCRELPDKSVLFCGTVSEQGNYNPCMARLDSSGEMIWLTSFATVWNDGSQKFELAENGDIWLVGESSTSAGTFFDTEIFRISASGQLLWQQWLGSPGQDAAFHIQRKESAPGFWVAGYSNAAENGNGAISPFLMSLDPEGNSLGEAFWPMPAPSPVYDMQTLGDSVFYLCGTSSNAAYLMRKKNPLLSQVFVVKSKSSFFSSQGYEGYEQIAEKYKSGEIESITQTDILGRTIQKLESRTDQFNLISTNGMVYLKSRFRDGRMVSSKFFSIR